MIRIIKDVIGHAMQYQSESKYCYQCLEPVLWLAPDGRCKKCTRCTPEEITGGAL